MAILLKGNIDLRIDPLEIEAALEFTADKNGETWSREKITRLLKEKSIIESVNPLVLERAIEHFSQLSEGTHSVIIAKGTPPVDPKESNLEWENLTVPDSLKDTVNNILEKTSPPLVYDHKTKKEAKEKKKLAFLTGKHKKNLLPDREIKIKVTVSPEIKKAGYVEKGNLIVTYLPSQAGSPGKNIFGQEVPPSAAKRIKLYYGDGIFQKGNELYSDLTGIVRIGNNWIDIIPYEAAYYRVYASEDNLECLMDFSPGSKGDEERYGEKISEQARGLGFQEKDLLPSAKIDGILEQARHYKKVLRGYSISSELEPLIKLSVAEDRLQATLSLHKGRGQGKRLSLQKIGEVIKTSNFGNMNLLKIKQDLLNFYKGKEYELHDYVLAVGTPPITGENGEIMWEITFAQTEEFQIYKAKFKTKEKEEETFPSLKDFPFNLVEKIARIKKDEKIAMLKPPQKGRSGVDVYGKKIDGLAGKEIKVALFENVKKYGQYIIAGEDGILEIGKKDDVILFRLKVCKDAQAFINLAADNMKAFLTIMPPKGIGNTLSLPELNKLIENQGIVRGINFQSLQNAQVLASKGMPVENVLFAQGREAVHGSGEEVIIKIKEASGKRVHILSDGRADYKYQDKITIIKKGELLAEITPPKGECIDGVDVLGNTIPARRTAGLSLTTGKNIRKELQKDGIIKIFAALDGEFIYENNFLDVRQFYLLNENVGLETGNIKFPGSIYITGSVLSGFVVIAGADLVIENLVEDALVSAEGSIIIKKGVKGSGKAILRAKKSIQCLFAENALILSNGDIDIKNFLLHCNIKCNGRLILGKEKGTIMGGTIRVKNGLELITLGSVSEIKTKICFGQDYLIADQIELQEKEIKKLGARALSIDALMKNQQKLKSVDPEKLRKLREDKFHILKLMEKGSKRLFFLREKFEEHYPGEVIVKGTVYPGVTIESHGRSYEVKEQKTMVAFIFNPRLGRIEVRALT
jgi:uncharacterized protein (DUF342 family)